MKYKGTSGNLSIIGSLSGITLNPKFVLLKTSPFSMFKGPAVATPIPNIWF